MKICNKDNTKPATVNMIDIIGVMICIKHNTALSRKKQQTKKVIMVPIDKNIFRSDIGDLLLLEFGFISFGRCSALIL